MNAIQNLEAAIRSQFPESQIRTDAGEGDSGIWFLDITLRSRTVNVEWRPAQGLGVSLVQSGAAQAPGFSNPDVIFESDKESEALAEVVRLLTSNVINSATFR